MKHAQQNTRPGEGLCSNACPGRGKRRRRPCSSFRDAPASCASGKRKHGTARARTPQRSTFKEHVPRPGRSRLAAAAASVKVVIYGFRDHAKTAPPITPPPRVRVGTMSDGGNIFWAPPRDAPEPRWPRPNLFFRLFWRWATLRPHRGWKSRVWRVARVLARVAYVSGAREKKNQLHPRPGGRAMIKQVKTTCSKMPISRPVFILARPEQLTPYLSTSNST